MYNDQVIDERVFQNKEAKYLQLLTNSLPYNGIEPLEDLDATSLYLVQVLHKGFENGGYLPLSMVRSLVSVKFFLMLENSYLGLPPMGDLYRSFM